MSRKIDVTNFPCHWHEDVVCSVGRMCDGCEHQPAPQDKQNGKAPPVPLKWESDYMGRGMGFPICPACGDMPYSTERCIFCGQPFIQDERTKAYNEPPEVERYDCLVCGGKGTVVGGRSKSNDHFHGICEACGCRVLE